MKRRTQNYYLIALRAFLKFLRKRGTPSLSPERIELAKVPERSLDLISENELKRLMAAPKTDTIEGKRDRAILELLFLPVLRISELCSSRSMMSILPVMNFLFAVRVTKSVLFFFLMKLRRLLKLSGGAQRYGRCPFIRYGKKPMLVKMLA